MISRLFPFLCMLTLALGSTVQTEEGVPIGPGKKYFENTKVRPDLIHVNKIITTIRDNWHLQESAEGIAKLCNMIRFRFPASESNEIFKAARYPFPPNPSVASQYLEGTYFICATHEVRTTTPNLAGINAKTFDGKHTIWNHYGDYNKPCDIHYLDVPFLYGFSNSYIDKYEYPDASPSIIVEFPYTAHDEVRSLGLVPGLSKAWNNIFVAVGGGQPDFYQYQFIAFPITNKVCPDIPHPALETLEKPDLPSSNELRVKNLRDQTH